MSGLRRPDWEPRLLELLHACGAEQTGHSGRTLLEHLVGTADRLRAWGRPDVECHAGLFHSIYGTQSFRIASVPMSRRAEVAALIGSEAEHLAYLFCVCRRREFRGEATGIVREHATGAEHAVSALQIAQLLEIEVANLLDQMPPRDAANAENERYMQELTAQIRGKVSERARAALDAWFS